VGLRAGLDWCGKSRPQPEFDPRNVQPVGSRYIDYAKFVPNKLKDNFKLRESVGMFVVLQQYVTSHAELQTFVIEAGGGRGTFARPQFCYFTFYKTITVIPTACILSITKCHSRT